MLLFRSEEHVDHWCSTRNLPKRPLVTLDQLWGLAVAWYSNRLTAEARRPMGAEIREIFDGLGLTDPFWHTSLRRDMREHAASILVSPDSLHKGGNITGEIWLEVADFEHPGKRWSDFPVIILGWWLDALFELWSGKASRGECFFMDGSYSFEVSKEQDAFVLRCYSDIHTAPECEWEGAIHLADLLRQVLDAASAVLRECQRRGWATADTEALESKRVHLDRVLNS